MSGDPRLTEARRLDAEATPGPWHAKRNPVGGYDVHTERGFLAELWGNTNHDAPLIAAMRNTWPAVLDLVALVLAYHSRNKYGYCSHCSGFVSYPCQEAWHALTMLDSLGEPS